MLGRARLPLLGFGDRGNGFSSPTFFAGLLREPPGNDHQPRVVTGGAFVPAEGVEFISVVDW